MSSQWGRVSVLAAALLILGGGMALGDGKVFVRERVPVSIPYQRALILFGEGTQTLVIQSQYKISGKAGKESQGWVVPVPAPPELASMDADRADVLFSDLDRVTAPTATRIREYLLIACLLGCPILSLLCLGLSFMPRFAGFKRGLRSTSWYSLLASVLLFFGVPLFLSASKGMPVLEIVDSRRVGIFDVRVIRSATGDGLLAWLNENSFQFGPEDRQAIDSYVKRGWCFVAAKIEPPAGTPESAFVSNGLLAPLILRFPTPDPVYPVALTATGGHRTQILVYLASDTPMRTSSPLILRYFASRDSWLPLYLLAWVNPGEFLNEARLDFRCLSKFKATLKSQEMANDIEFHPAPDTHPYREHVYRW